MGTRLSGESPPAPLGIARTKRGFGQRGRGETEGGRGGGGCPAGDVRRSAARHLQQNRVRAVVRHDALARDAAAEGEVVEVAEELERLAARLVRVRHRQPQVRVRHLRDELSGDRSHRVPGSRARHAAKGRGGRARRGRGRARAIRALARARGRLDVVRRRRRLELPPVPALPNPAAFEPNNVVRQMGARLQKPAVKFRVVVAAVVVGGRDARQCVRYRARVRRAWCRRRRGCRAGGAHSGVGLGITARARARRGRLGPIGRSELGAASGTRERRSDLITPTRRLARIRRAVRRHFALFQQARARVHVLAVRAVATQVGEFRAGSRARLWRARLGPQLGPALDLRAARRGQLLRPQGKELRCHPPA